MKEEITNQEKKKGALSQAEMNWRGSVPQKSKPGYNVKTW